MTDSTILRATRLLGALALLAVGAVHLQQYLGDGYRMIPTIGPLFLLNAIGSAIVGVGLLMPLERWLTVQRARAATGFLAIAAVLIAVGSLAGLFISESASLFGFTEHGYRAAIVVAIIAEGATVLLLSPVAAIKLIAAISRGESQRAGGRETAPRPPMRARRGALPQ